MRVAVDITPLLAVRTGVGRFTEELISRLAARPDLDVIGLSVSWRGRGQRPASLPPGVAMVHITLPARVAHQLWQRTPWPVVERWTGDVAVVHGTNYVVPPARHAAQLVTVHDLTIARYPELAEPAAVRFMPLVTAAIGRGAHVHTVSRYVADEVIEWYGDELSADRVHVVPNGVTPRSGDPERARALVGSAPYVLAIGAIEPRKQLPRLVAAFDELAVAHPELALVVAGPDGWGVDDFKAAVEGARHRRRIIRLGWIDDTTRADLLAAAELLAFPSTYEGFGLPPLEAMSAGTPVVASRAGAIPEVTGDAALLVDPHDTDELAGAINRVITDDELRQRMIDRGRKRAADYTWERTADGISSVYSELTEAGGA